jgi:hypothetical protein
MGGDGRNGEEGAAGTCVTFPTDPCCQAYDVNGDPIGCTTCSEQSCGQPGGIGCGGQGETQRREPDGLRGAGAARGVPARARHRRGA